MLVDSPPRWAAGELMTGGSCLWSPIKTTCDACRSASPLYEITWSARTPLDSGNQDRGSVAMLASSRKTIGKSMTSRLALTELKQVAHTCASASTP